jgi:hypothetical protein
VAPGSAFRGSRIEAAWAGEAAAEMPLTWDYHSCGRRDASGIGISTNFLRYDIGRHGETSVPRLHIGDPVAVL